MNRLLTFWYSQSTPSKVGLVTGTATGVTGGAACGAAAVLMASIPGKCNHGSKI